jgi:hypothetical protein
VRPEDNISVGSILGISKDSILLGIFAGEREYSIQKSKNRFRIGPDSFAKIGKTLLKSPRFGVCLTKISHQLNVNALCKQQMTSLLNAYPWYISKKYCPEPKTLSAGST